MFLGTSSMVPTSDRNHSALLLNYKAEHILIDCGEGTQRQLRKAKFSAAKLTKILISHWHGDHVFGLPGLIQTLIANGFTKELEVYGPKGTKKFFDLMLKAFIIKGNMIKLTIKEIGEGKFFENEDFILEAHKLEHGHCLGYNFIEKDRRKVLISKLKKYKLTTNPILRELQQGKDIIWNGKKIKVNDVTSLIKGRKISIVSDTGPNKVIAKMCKDATLMISESTYAQDLQKLANERNHLTSQQAATYAKQAKVKNLVITHFSQRYSNVKDLLKEARKIFKKTEAASDFLRISL